MRSFKFGSPSTFAFDKRLLAIETLAGLRVEQQDVAVEYAANVLALDPGQFEEKHDFARLVEHVHDRLENFDRSSLRLPSTRRLSHDRLVLRRLLFARRFAQRARAERVFKHLAVLLVTPAPRKVLEIGKHREEIRQAARDLREGGSAAHVVLVRSIVLGHAAYSLFSTGAFATPSACSIRPSRSSIAISDAFCAGASRS